MLQMQGFKTRLSIIICREIGLAGLAAARGVENEMGCSSLHCMVLATVC